MQTKDIKAWVDKYHDGDERISMIILLIKKLEAVEAIRDEYDDLIKQNRGLIGAYTVLDMIDAALDYEEGIH